MRKHRCSTVLVVVRRDPMRRERCVPVRGFKGMPPHPKETFKKYMQIPSYRTQLKILIFCHKTFKIITEYILSCFKCECSETGKLSC